ncbi:MAG: YraN family protein [Chitinispirillaceae bacterium]|nr:YraN family protein [Chitinispirillaceae bacterium]
MKPADECSSGKRPGKGPDTREKGDRGENQAVEYLLGRGYSIVCRKYQSRRGEIDCIARDPDGTLVFIEVKSSMGTSCGSPFFWVTPAKQRTLFSMARQYLAEHRIGATPCRFDVIAITRGKIEHLRNAIIGM